MASTRRPALPVTTADLGLASQILHAPQHGPLEPAASNTLRAVGFGRLARINILRHMLMKMLSKHLRHQLFSTMDNGHLPLTAWKIRLNYADTGGIDSPLANRIPVLFPPSFANTCCTDYH